jgi:hypothetical protein
VTREDAMYESPGSAAMSGGPYVERLSSVATTSTAIHSHESVCTTSQTSP